MTQEIVSKNKEALQKALKESNEWARVAKANGSIYYTTEQFKNMIELGHIPEELGERWLKNLEEMSKQAGEIMEFRKQNPDADPNEVILKFFKPRTIDDVHADIELNKVIFELLSSKRDVLENASDLNIINLQLFKNIDPHYDFPTIKAIMDRMFHFHELMKKAKLYQLANSDEWILSATIGEDKKDFIGDTAGDYKGDAGPIGFEYSFSASSQEEAVKNSEAYKKEMLENGIKVYVAFSKMMHEKSSPHFSCKITDVMKLTADPERKAYFTQKEKADFWRTTRILERTKLTIVIPVRIEKKIRTKYTTVTEKVSIDLRMLNINLKDATRKIPSFFQVSILDVNKFKDKSTLATGIAHTTLLLKPNRRVAFGVLLQIFLEQQRGKIRTRDESSLIELAGLHDTAKSNISVARARLREDLDELKSKGIISGWSEKSGRYTFEPPAQKKIANKI